MSLSLGTWPERGTEKGRGVMVIEGERGERGLDQGRRKETRTGIDDTAAEAGRGGGEAEAGVRERKREREQARANMCILY